MADMTAQAGPAQPSLTMRPLGFFYFFLRAITIYRHEEVKVYDGLSAVTNTTKCGCLDGELLPAASLQTLRA